MHDHHDLVVIGGGTAGMVAAVGAADLGARVLLAEEHRTGGDCLWTGCVPSKALVAAARRAHDLRTADRVGLAAVDPVVDLARVMDHVHDSIAAIEPHDSPPRLRRDGVDVVEERARVVGPGIVEVGGRPVHTRNVLVATGATPAIPPIAGIDDVEVLTSDTLWGLRELPGRLAVMGGGPVGVEMAQAFARLGSRVTVVEQADRLLPGVDPEAAEAVTSALRADGVRVLTGVTANRVDDGVLYATSTGDRPDREISFDRLLVATGRRPRTDDLGLDVVGVELDPSGAVVVDRTMATRASGVWAAGDVIGGMGFTHVAAAQAGVVVGNALFGLRRRFRPSLTPWTIFADPEIAHVGWSERRARRRWGDDAVVWRLDHDEVDRAVTDGATEGFTKLVADPRGRLVGATVVGRGAGESVAEVVAWLSNGAGLTTVAAATHSYPTMAESISGAALPHARNLLQSPRLRRVTRPLLTLRRRVGGPR